MSTENKPIVFYDGSCPLCSKEINHYKKLDSAHRVSWYDISKDQTLLNDYGISFEQAMKRLHGVTAEGTIVIGVDAFVMFWKELPYYHHLGKGITSLGLNKLLNPVYFRFADWRYKKQHCSIVSRNNCSNQNR